MRWIVIVGLISTQRSANTSTLVLPIVLDSAANCRLILDSATLSRSMSVSVPIPERASASTAHEPTPPTPITAMCAWEKRANAASPYRRIMPPKRRLLSISLIILRKGHAE